jgi:hypothetical protein
MHVIEEHQSPDGLLKFVVTRLDGGDVSLGFVGFPWHTHGEILASLSGLPQDAAVRQFVDTLLQSRSIIATSSIGGSIRDVWIADDTAPDKYKPDDETIYFRFWDGRSAA